MKKISQLNDERLAKTLKKPLLPQTKVYLFWKSFCGSFQIASSVEEAFELWFENADPQGKEG